MRILLCDDPAVLATALLDVDSATVEAVYDGDLVVYGSRYTLAHSGPRFSFPAPCSYRNEQVTQETVDVIGINRLDLNVLGGCMALMGCRPDEESFWQLAAFVDVNGREQVYRAKADAEDIRRIFAYWAWEFPLRSRPGEAVDVLDQVELAARTIWKILAAELDFLEQGDKMRRAQLEAAAVMAG